MNNKINLYYLLIYCLIFLTAIPAEAKYRGPSTAKLTKTAELIAVVRVNEIDPPDKSKKSSEDKADLQSMVKITIVECIKGDNKLDSLIIGSTGSMETGDCRMYQVGQEYLVFLVKKGDIYRAVIGRVGVFEKAEDLIYGWPKKGQSAYPKPDRSVKLNDVRKEILSYMDVGMLRRELFAPKLL
ncbi:MAG: hypothetical protein ABFD46_10545 [Armatimonadota bacterium]